MHRHKKLSLDSQIALLLFIVLSFFYFFTLCPSIFVGPSVRRMCELLHISTTPAPLYPVWQILAGIFRRLSGDPAYGVNLLSAIAAAAAVAIFYWTIAQLGNRHRPEQAETAETKETMPFLTQAAALSAALLLAFSRSFWEAAVTAGSGTLNVLFLVAPAYLLVKYAKYSIWRPC